MFTKKKQNRIADTIALYQAVADQLNEEVETHRARGVLDHQMMSKVTAASYANGRVAAAKQLREMLETSN